MNMRRAVFVAILCTLAGTAHGAGARSGTVITEPVEARLQAVNPYSRVLTLDGQNYSIGGTAPIKVPGRAVGTLRDLVVGMRVRLDLLANDRGAAQVRAVTVLPD
jgi:hypothetical protein